MEGVERAVSGAFQQEADERPWPDYSPEMLGQSHENLKPCLATKRFSVKKQITD